MATTTNQPDDGQQRNSVLDKIAVFLETLDGDNGDFLDGGNEAPQTSNNYFDHKYCVTVKGVNMWVSREEFEAHFEKNGVNITSMNDVAQPVDPTDAVRELQQVTLRLMRDLEIVRRSQGIHTDKIDSLKADLDTAIGIACELDKRLVQQQPDTQVFAAWDKRERGIWARLRRFVAWLFLMD